MASFSLWRSFHFCLLLIGLCAANEVGGRDANVVASERLAEATSDPEALVVASFCVPWYEPCKELEQEIIKTQEILEPWASVLQFSCDEAADFCAAQAVVSYPTIRVFKGKDRSRYRARFTATSIATEVLRGVLPPVIQAEAGILEKLKLLEFPVLVATIGPGDGEGPQQEFEATARHLQGRFFCVTTSENSAGSLDTPFVTVHNALDETNAVYRDAFTSGALIAFSNKVSSPLIARLDLKQLAGFMQSGLPLGLIFAQDPSERQALAHELTQVALRFHGELNMATADAKKLPFLAEPLGVDSSRYPAFVIQTQDDAMVFDQNTVITAKAIEKFILGALNPREREL